MGPFWWWRRWSQGGDDYARRCADWALQEAYAQRERADSYGRACAEWAARVVASGGVISEPPPVLPPAPEIGAPAPACGDGMTALEVMREQNRRARSALDSAHAGRALGEALAAPLRAAAEQLGGGARRRYARDSGDPGVACDYRPEWAVPLAPQRPK